MIEPQLDGKFALITGVNHGIGATQTGYITPENEPKLIAMTSLRRLGQPEDFADIIVFLASEQAHWLTGQLIYASGGFLMYLNE
jgi:3-oxoacyl-[acyl-carrier protein] reductase